jgi:CHAT domain-containing protein
MRSGATGASVDTTPDPQPRTPMAHCILVVEDNDELRKALVATIREECPACEVMEKGNEKDAAVLIAQHLFAVVVTDIDLRSAKGSAHGGFTVVKAARERDPDTQVIVVTFRATPRHLQQIRELTAFSYINRSIENHDKFLREELREGIRRFEELRSTGIALDVWSPAEPNGPLDFRLSTRGVNQERCHAIADFDTSLWKELATAIGSMAATSPDGSWDALPKFVGREMWNRLFRGHEELLLALGEAKARAIYWKNVVMKFHGRGHILDVPFELMNNGTEYLAIRQPVVVVPPHVDNCPAPFRNIREAGQLRALLIASDTRTLELGPIPAVDNEIANIAASLGQIRPAPKIVKVHSWEPLSRVNELLKQQWHLIHYAGHGTFQEKQPDRSGLHFWETGCLELDWETARVQQARANPWATARDLTGWENSMANMSVRDLRGEVLTLTAGSLENHLRQKTPWLLYLNCCESARAAKPGALFHSELLSLMGAAVNAGVPVVIGNRWPVRDENVTLQMIDSFYDALRREHTPEYALHRARCTAHAHSSDVITWASPVISLSS